MNLPARFIACENPEQKIWDLLAYYENEPSVKAYLKERYAQIERTEPEKFAFLNTHRMIYYIKQAKEFFESAQEGRKLVQPLLLYYGMMSFSKAVILSKDPDYPATTEHLKHGMTTRKIKKTRYRFAYDDIRMKRKGLLALLFQRLSGQGFEEKYTMLELLNQIPELAETCGTLYRQQALLPITIHYYKEKDEQKTVMEVPNSILDAYHLTQAAFLSLLNRHGKRGLRFHDEGQAPRAKTLSLRISALPDGRMEDQSLFIAHHHPLFVADYKGRLFLRTDPDSKLWIPELCGHFMIMFVLGMLCRYETELWSEMNYAFTSEDLYVIQAFIQLTMRKFPNLVLEALAEQPVIIKTE